MWNKLFKIKFFDILFPLALVGIAGILAATNFTPNTWLSGWDTLHPEFNLSLAAERAISGVWRSDQGVGAIAAHSHMAELPRLVFLWLTSLAFPVNVLRYLYFFVCLILGPLGVYAFIRSSFGKKQKFASSIGALLGGVYYLLNLATLQHFYVPFEMFATQYAFLPWLFLLASKFTKSGKKKSLALFGLVSVLAAPQAYAATLFYAGITGLILFLGGLAAVAKRKIQAFKRVAIVIAMLLITNAFWLLPNIYSIINQSETVSNSKINQLFTPEAILHNEAYGDIADVLINKNFLFSWREYDDQKGEFVNLMDEWISHLKDPKVMIIFYSVAAIAILGLLLSSLRRQKVAIALLPVFIFSLFFLLNNNGPLAPLYTFLRNHSKLLEEGFRMPFTKFSILFLLILSFYFGSFFATLGSFISNKLLRNALLSVAATVTIIGLIFSMRPAFLGNLISPSMRVSIPSEYFDLFTWFNKNEKGRIATLPMNTLWGWKYNKWGYEGAGFLWFGIDNPVMERDFDRWNPHNEAFYKQASAAIYANDIKGFADTFEKYGIGYALLDTSIINAGASESQLAIPEIRELLAANNYQKVAQFNFLEVYKVNTNTGTGLFAPKNLPQEDSTLGDFVISTDTQTVTQTSELRNKNGSYTLEIPDILEKEEYVVADVFAKRIGDSTIQVSFVLQTPKIIVDGKQVFSEPIRFYYDFINVKSDIGYLTIANKTFPISSLSSEDLALGSVSVATKGETKIALFAKDEIQNNDFLKQIMANNATWCSDEQQKVSKSQARNGFVLTAKGESVCLGNEVVVKKPMLSKLSFQSPSKLFPLFCINKPGVKGCVNDGDPTRFSILGSTRENQYLTPLESGGYWFAFVAQAKEEGEQEISFANVSMSSFAQIDSASVSFGDAFGVFSRPTKIEINDPKTLSIVSPYKTTISEQFALHRGHGEAVNCDLEKLGSVSKKTVGESVIYEATDSGVSCDYYDFPKLLNGQGYVLRIQGENQKGRSMKLYLQNKVTNHMDREELFGKGKFDELYELSPTEGGYVLNIETRAFGKIESKNTLTNIEFIPMPLKWVSDISLTKKDQNSAEEKENKLEIIKPTKHGLLYQAQLNTKSEVGLLALSESYDAGWIAIDLTDKRVLTHKTVNGWANAWEVPSGERNIIVVFIPQLLEVIGLMALPLVFIILIVRKTKRAKIEQNNR